MHRGFAPAIVRPDFAVAVAVEIVVAVHKASGITMSVQRYQTHLVFYCRNSTALKYGLALKTLANAGVEF